MSQREYHIVVLGSGKLVDPKSLAGARLTTVAHQVELGRAASQVCFFSFIRGNSSDRDTDHTQRNLYKMYG